MSIAYDNSQNVGPAGPTGATGPTGPTGPGITVVSAPATKTSTGSVGQIAYDSQHIYVCVGTNSWVRSNTDNNF